MENFNYISFYNISKVDGNIDSISMELGRMFEYTPPDIEKRLQNYSDIAKDFLESLPTFLCTEIQRDDDGYYSIIKYGKINNIIKKNSEVEANFQTEIDFGKVKFDDPKSAKDLFYLDRFQISRTHWAVREGDAQEILKNLVKLKPDLSKFVIPGNNFLQDKKDIQPPPREKNILGLADSVESFLKLLYQSRTGEEKEFFFVAIVILVTN